MKIVSVTPLAKGIFKDNLSYFTSKDLNIGSIVTVLIRNKPRQALVMEVKEIGDLKTELRQSNFALKKIINVKKKNLFQEDFINAAQKTADYFGATLGQVISSFTPIAILEKNLDSQKETNIKFQNTNQENSGKITKIEKYILQEPDEERLALYKKLIREAFAQKKSILICAPTNADVRYLKTTLSRGIEDYAVCLCSDDTEKEQNKNWEKAVKNNHPFLIVSTPLFLSLPRNDLLTIIIERENATAYKQLARPFIDTRFFIEKLAENKRTKIVLGDILLRSETIERKQRGEFVALSPITYRSFSSAQKQTLIKQQEKNPSEFGQAISQELKKILEKTTGERWFIFSGRRGLNPLAVCSDCGHIFSCPHCQTTLILHQEKETNKKITNYFLCHKCGYTTTAEDKCQHCGGWKIALLGAGSDKIENELKKLFPNTKIFRLDSDIIKNHKKISVIIKNFYSSPGSFLIGTEMALFYLRDKIENIAVIGIDAYFSVPEFRISEKIFNILLRLRNLTIKNFVIQTRNPEEEILGLALQGNSTEFHRREINERKKLKYPPFSILIKISVKNNNKVLTETLETLKENHLSSWQTIIYDSISKNHHGEATTNLLLRLPSDQWPNKEILNLLNQLPPTFLINVDPENIF